MGIKETLHEVIYAIIPIVVLVCVLQSTIANLPMEVFINFIGGSIMVIIGLTLFIAGAKTSFLPIGELIGSSVVKKGKLCILTFLGLASGFLIALAEPSIQMLSTQLAGMTGGSISRNNVVSTIALGTGILVALGMLRIFLRIPILYILTGGYALAFLLSLFTAPEFAALSFDAGGVATGPVTVPFILSLGVGVASVIGKRSGSDDGFGLVALASLGTTLAVLIMGVFQR